MILLEVDPSPVYALAFSPDGSLLKVGTRAGGITTFQDLSSIVSSFTPHANSTPVTALGFSPSSDWTVIGGEAGWLGVHTSGAATGIGVKKLPARPVSAMRFVTETLLAVAFGERARRSAGGVELWDVTTIKPREPRLTAPDGVRTLDVCRAIPRLAWGEWGRRLGVWDIQSAAVKRVPLAHDPTAVALAPDGSRVAVALQWTVMVLDAVSHQRVYALEAHKGTVTAVLYTPDGRVLITGSWDGTVRFWDAATGRAGPTFQWPIGKVCSLALSTDGLQLAAGGDRGGLVVFDCP